MTPLTARCSAVNAWFHRADLSVLKDLGGEFRIPICSQGCAEDFTTPTELDPRCLASIKALRKAFVRIPGGHFAEFMNSSRFLEVLVRRVRPLGVRN
jgi:hypothetical protein